MIRLIKIRNFAIIESADIEFHDGLNIVTGETGAGKSIVIEAVSLALGSRADSTFVRAGCDKATIQMIADYEGEEYIITREISAAGKNICRINDEIVTLGTLSSLCKKIADIHGQYDHQSLLNPEYHIRLVDLYRKDLINPAKEAVATLYGEYTGLRKQLADLHKQLAESKRQQDFMAFELQEIREANLRVGEDVELEREINMLQNSEHIYENLANAYEISSESEYSILSALKQVSVILDDTSEFSEELVSLSERANSVYYELEDICSGIRQCRDASVFSPEDLDACIGRIEVINRLKNKHGKSIIELLDYADELETSLGNIENADHLEAELTAEIKKMQIALSGACNKLSDARKESALSLQKLITEQLAQLNFNNADFSIDFKKADQFTAEGTDIVEFLITTNKGEPLKPLSRIASGGEMSRIMLAFKKIIGDYDEIPTMIFDEIDSGISGITASIVGRKLCEIAESHQIICITHLPQIAAFGKNNYRIQKSSDDNMTFTSIVHLTTDEKVDEIARLLGGTNITETTLASARELVEASVV